MEKIRIAQIGTSIFSHGNAVWGTLRKHPEVFEIVGYAMPEGEKERLPEQMGRFAPYPELTVEQILKDPTIEAVTVETDELYLTEYALMAAKAGKHIHMEKPGGADPEKFRELIATMKQTGKVFHTGYMYRYNPYVQALMEQVRRGELGQILSVDAQMSCGNEPDCREHISRFPGGMMFYLGCHLIDLVYGLQGKPRQVTPYLHRTGLDGVDSQDLCMAVLEYPCGLSTVKSTHVENGAFCRRHLTVVGTKKTVEIRPLETLLEKQQCTTQTVYTGMDVREQGVKEQSAPYHRYAPMLLSFAQMVRGEKENPWSCDYELELYEIIMRCCGK